MRIGGHRGLPRRYPDNTLEGIVAAGSACDYVEIDVRKAADGTLVLSHDPDIVGCVVAESSWEDLALLDVGDGHHPTTLRAALAAAPSPLDIEIKNSPFEPGFDETGALAEEVGRMARPDDVLTCFFWPTMDAVRRALPDVRTGLLVDQGGDLIAAARHAAQRGHELLAPHWSLLVGDPDLCRSLVLEFEVAAWTVDDPDVARSLEDLGIDSIITNDPEAIGAAVGMDARP